MVISGLMESKQFSTGGHLWMESSFLPTKSRHQGVRTGVRSTSASVTGTRSRLEHYNNSWSANNGELSLEMLRLEDQIF